MVTSRRLVWAVVLVAIVVLGSALPALAQDLAPVWSYTFDAGTVCSFALQIDSYGGDHLIIRTFYDRNGNPVRWMQVGKGQELTYTNPNTGATLWTRSNGADNHTTYNADGSQTVVLTGHNIVFLFPTDHPAGPSTTLYVGRIQYRLDDPGGANIFTLQETSGTATDICAALS